MVTTIQVDEGLKKKLDALKIHHRETYNELILRLISNHSPNASDRESLIETIEILSDPSVMRDLAQALENYNKGNWITLDQLEKGLKL